MSLRLKDISLLLTAVIIAALCTPSPSKALNLEGVVEESTSALLALCSVPVETHSIIVAIEFSLPSVILNPSQTRHVVHTSLCARGAASAQIP